MDVSVIIPTRNRKGLLGDALASLAQQDWPACQLEVVVVDDGSTDGTADVAAADFPYALRCLRQANCGAAPARNTGAEQARGELLIFLDDDMLLEPSYVSGLVEEHQSHARIVGMGTPMPYLPPHPTPYARLYGQLAAPTTAVLESAFGSFQDCVTNNLSVERADFFEIGGMRDPVGHGGGAWWGDVDFGYRAVQKGFRFRRSGKARCCHRDYAIENLPVARDRAYQIGRLAVRLFHQHPELEAELPMFRDKVAIEWSTDSPVLIGRKLARRAASSGPMMAAMERLVGALEQRSTPPNVLVSLYRWMIGGEIYRGYWAEMHARGEGS